MATQKPAPAKLATNEFLKKVFEQARSASGGTKPVIETIRNQRINWADRGSVVPMRTEFYVGYMSDILGYDHAQARFCYEEKSSPPKPGEKKKVAKAGDNTRKEYRTKKEQDAYGSAKSAFSFVARSAGQPNKVTGKPRAPRLSNADKALLGEGKGANVTSIMTGKVILPACTKPEQVGAFALRMAGIVGEYVNKNSKLVTGDLGSALRAFVENVPKLANTKSE